MKKSFPEYYDSEIKKLWREAIFVFDANVLLDVYRFSPKTSEALISILNHEKVESRIWIPNHYAYEYHKNLTKIRGNVRKDYNDRSNELNRICGNIIERLEEFSKKTGFEIDEGTLEGIKSNYQNNLTEPIESITSKFSEFQKLHHDRLSTNSLEEKIAKLFKGKVGPAYCNEELEKIYAEGKTRFDRRIPPGFKRRDREKGEPQCYGDLVGWFQIIKHVQDAKVKRPIIMITDDSSGEDWFDKPEGKPKGPRPELVKEIREKAGVSFYLYKTKQFIGEAQHVPALQSRKLR